MDEPTPPLAIYPEPKPKRPRKSGTPEGGMRVMFLLCGCSLGIAAMFAYLRFEGAPPPRVVYQTVPAPQQPVDSGYPKPVPPVGQKTQANPGSPVQAAGVPGPNPAATPKPGDKPPVAPNSGKGTQPFNPFDGSVASAMPPKEISGKISPGNAPVLPKVGGTGGGDSEPAGTPQGLLVTIRLDISDPAAAVKALESIAAKAGGSGIQFDEVAAKDDAEGVVLFVPAAKVDEAEKQIGAVGGLLVSDKWNGTSADRLDRIERAADDRLSELHIKRQELLIKYFEDAPQVKHLDQDSDRIKRCVDAVHAIRPGPNTAVIKIKFVS